MGDHSGCTLLEAWIVGYREKPVAPRTALGRWKRKVGERFRVLASSRLKHPAGGYAHRLMLANPEYKSGRAKDLSLIGSSVNELDLNNPPSKTYENSEADDMAGLHKVRTASGSDRVVSQKLDYAGHYKIWPY